MPREHLSSCNAVIMDLYSLDLLSWSTDSLWTGDREQKEKKPFDCLNFSVRLVRQEQCGHMICWGVRSEIRSTHAGAELLFISCELQVNNVRSMMKELGMKKKNPLLLLTNHTVLEV